MENIKPEELKKRLDNGEKKQPNIILAEFPFH